MTVRFPHPPTGHAGHGTKRPGHNGTGSGPGLGLRQDVRLDKIFRPRDATYIAIRTEHTPHKYVPALGRNLYVDYIQARLMDTSPQIIGGGGFEDVLRPLRRGLVQWRGTASPTLPLSIIFDGVTTHTGSVEHYCELLEHWSGNLSGPRDPEPPKLLLYGAMLPREAKQANRRWVIMDPPAWDTSPAGVIRHEVHGYRIRQAVDLNLVLVDDDEVLQRTRHPKPHPRYRHIKARAGDTYEKIAKRELGTKRLAHKLAALNGHGGGAITKKLKKGQDVKLPTGKLLEQWKHDLKKK